MHTRRKEPTDLNVNEDTTCQCHRRFSLTDIIYNETDARTQIKVESVLIAASYL